MELMTDRGFTLVELLIVVAVMAIISVVGLTSFTFSLQKSRDTVRKSDLALAAKAIEAWAGDFGQYPEGDATGRMVACDPSNTGTLSACDWGKTMVAYPGGGLQLYLAKLPKDPVSGNTYYYAKTATGFDLFSILENTKDALYQADAGAVDFGAGTIFCGSGAACNYQVTQAGPK